MRKGILYHISKKSKRALIIFSGALGDFLLSLPVFWHISAPNYFHLLSGEHLHPLVDICPIIERSYLIDRAFFLPLFSNKVDFESSLVQWLESYEKIYQVGCYPINNPSDTPLFFIKNFTKKLKNIHATDYIAKQIGVNSFPSPPFLNFNKIDIKAYRKRFSLKKEYLVFHPGSGSAQKVAYLKEISDYLSPWEENLIILAGPADTNSIKIVKEILPKATILEGIDLREAGYIIYKSKLFLGFDSGIAHLAWALKVNSIVIFKNTDPNIWGHKESYCINLNDISKLPLILNKWTKIRRPSIIS